MSKKPPNKNWHAIYHKNDNVRRAGLKRGGPEDERTPPKRTTPRAEASNAIRNLNAGDDTAQMDQSADDGASGSADVAMDASGSAGGSASNSAGGNMRGQAVLPLGLPGNTKVTYTREYNKQYLFRIFNDLNAYRTGIHGTAAYTDSVPNILSLPVGSVGFYLNISEMNRLKGKTNVKIKACEVEVHNKTAVTTFETASVATAVGNNNLGVYLIQLDPNVGEKSQIVPVESFSAFIQTYCWGIDTNNLPLSVSLSTALTGVSATRIRRNVVNRVGFRTIRSGAGDSWQGNAITNVPQQLFDHNRHIVAKRNASMQEGLFCKWGYAPTDGTIFAQTQSTPRASSSFQTGATFSRRNNPYMSRHQNGQDVLLRKGPIGNATLNATTSNDNIYIDNFRNDTTIASLRIDNSFVNKCNAPQIPVLMVGIEPEIAINSLTGVATAVPCHVDLTVNVRCLVEITEGTSHDISETGIITEFEYRHPPQRAYITDNNGPQGLHRGFQTNFNANEITMYTTPTTNVVPTTWSMNGPTTSMAEAEGTDETEATTATTATTAEMTAKKLKSALKVTRPSGQNTIKSVKRSIDFIEDDSGSDNLT